MTTVELMLSQEIQMILDASRLPYSLGSQRHGSVTLFSIICAGTESNQKEKDSKPRKLKFHLLFCLFSISILCVYSFRLISKTFLSFIVLAPTGILG